MDIKTKLEDEIILTSNDNSRRKMIQRLNENGFFTIEDFINTDVELLSRTEPIRKEFRIYQHILRTKYLGEPLVLDAYLNEEYELNWEKYSDGLPRKCFATLERLGLGILPFKIENELRKIDAPKKLKMNEIIKIIFMRDRCGISYRTISMFYLDYYNKNMVTDVQEVSASSIAKLKEEILILSKKRDELDAKIAFLTEKLNDYRRGM